MGHSLFPGTKHRRRRDHFGNAARYDDDDCHNDSAPARRLRIPGTVLLGGIVIWSLLALGVWALVDPLGREATAVRDVANVDGLVGWAIGPVHFLAKGGLVLVWLVGSFTLIALPIVLRRRSR